MPLLQSLFRRFRPVRQESPRSGLAVELLEARTTPSVTAALTNGQLVVTGDAQRNVIQINLDPVQNQIVVENTQQEVARFPAGSVTSVVVDTDGGSGTVRIDPALTLPAFVHGTGNVKFFGGGGMTTLAGGSGNSTLVAGDGKTALLGGTGHNIFLRVKNGVDQVNQNPGDQVTLDVLPVPAQAPPTQVLTTDEVQTLLQRAAAASSSKDAIIAIVDRGGRVLGVRAESGVSPALMDPNHPELRAFAVDGALAEARTGAFFGNNQAPLTSRTIQDISQTTMTQREIESNPNSTDPTVLGPGFVAPIGIKGHFPPGVPFTPQVDLFAIEHTNRDTTRDKGVMLTQRFNVPSQFIPSSILAAGQQLVPPDSYGYISGTFLDAKPRGIGTLPGGIPIFKNNQVVGGIGVFFPGKNGYANQENSALSADYDPTKPDRSLEAEYIAFAALGGAVGSLDGVTVNAPVGSLGGIAPLPEIKLPVGRIDLVGITLDVFGPSGLNGPNALVQEGKRLGVGDPNDGTNLPVGMGANAPTLLQGTPVPDGWLVTPHDGVGISAAEVTRIITDGINQANATRAAIRLPLGSRTKMVFAVADRTGAILGLYRMPDATIFSIDVAVAKARNVAYYADPTQLQPQDQLPGVPLGAALTNRSFRFLALPRNPEGIDGTPPGPFSILNDGGVDPNTGLNVGPPKPASAYQSVQGHDAFNPGTNFRDPNNPLNQNGIVFFPGSSPLYRSRTLIGGFGVSGDGVDQDDVVTIGGQQGFEPPDALRIDQFTVNGLRIPYQKNNRNPLG